MTHPRIQFSSDNYFMYTKEVSGVTRSLALADIAVIWLFAGGLAAKDAPPQQLLDRVNDSRSLSIALVAAVFALTCDLLQYVAGAFAWGTYRWAVENVITRGLQSPALAWQAARFLGFVKQLEVAIGVAPGPDFRTRKTAIAQGIRAGHTLKPSVVELLAREEGPVILRLTSNMLFWLKVTTLMGAFVATLIFLA